MKNIIISFLLLVVVGELITLGVINHKNKNAEVLSEATQFQSPTPLSTPTDSPSPTPEPTVNPTDTPKPTPTPTQTPTPVPQPTYSSEEINGFIERFAAQYSVDPNILRHIAVCESGFDPSAEKLSYVGLYQFGPVTWKNFREEFGEDTDINLRFNAEEAVQTAAYAISVGKKGIWPNCFP